MLKLPLPYSTGNWRIPRPERLAGCRACCEEYIAIDNVFNIVDSSGCCGESYRTVSGWKHSSTKVLLSGVTFLKRRC